MAQTSSFSLFDSDILLFPCLCYDLGTVNNRLRAVGLTVLVEGPLCLADVVDLLSHVTQTGSDFASSTLLWFYYSCRTIFPTSSL